VTGDKPVGRAKRTDRAHSRRTCPVGGVVKQCQAGDPAIMSALEDEAIKNTYADTSPS
jgi:hypothetical protein